MLNPLADKIMWIAVIAMLLLILESNDVFAGGPIYTDGAPTSSWRHICDFVECTAEQKAEASAQYRAHLRSVAEQTGFTGVSCYTDAATKQVVCRHFRAGQVVGAHREADK